jgi:hypothetical protein
MSHDSEGLIVFARSTLWSAVTQFNYEVIVDRSVSFGKVPCNVAAKVGERQNDREWPQIKREEEASPNQSTHPPLYHDLTSYRRALSLAIIRIQIS